MAIANPPERATAPTALIINDPQDTAASKLEKILITGDLAALTPDQRVFYYREVCASLDLNPLTRPFDYLSLNSKLVLYANRSCTDQLRASRRIEVTKLERERADDLAIVTAYGRDRTGRQDSSIGAVNIKNLQGEALANALMKAETKAKRRLTLSLAGLGLLDEVEVDAVPGAWRVSVDPTTGVITDGLAPERAPKSLEDRLAAKAAALDPEAQTTSQPVDAGHVAPDGSEAAGSPAPEASAESEESTGLHSGSADVVEGEFTEQVTEGLGAGELRTWLREHRIDFASAATAARERWGDQVTLDNLTDGQRGQLRDQLAK
jgi:hypothetical protein